MATVYFLCGLAAAGKTSLAKKLASEKDAVRFTLDERMIAKYDYTIYDPQYGPLATKEKELIWEEAQDFLANGRDVILDWSLWSKKARVEWPQRVLAAGYDYRLYYLDASLEILRRRLSKRNTENNSRTHYISIAELERFSNIFEAPTEAENLNLEVIHVHSD